MAEQDVVGSLHVPIKTIKGAMTPPIDAATVHNPTAEERICVGNDSPVKHLIADQPPPMQNFPISAQMI